MIRIAVLGCGRIGATHAANIAAHPSARLAAVQDINGAAAQAVAAFTGARVMISAAEESGVEGIRDYLDVELARVVF
jgi:myo-inositol 2-dehydrogenase / D-chiro-inositol 1-dehydrogenase